MDNPRKYGRAPYEVALIHGGPGAPGEMAPVARELASKFGVLEPLQTANTLEGQIVELKNILENNAAVPCSLVGYSWGAWLSIIVAARYPLLVKRMILISSGPFEAKYARDIMKTRLSRLEAGEREEIISFVESLDDVDSSEMNNRMARFGLLMSKADSFDPIPHANEVSQVQSEIFQNVWKEADELRGSGKLLELAAKVQCPVLAIHGDHDPHPAKGVENPLSHLLTNFRFILIRNCGHTPWIERQAKDKFYKILKRECR
jgi:pimeloyl-ACP methyl ester carboxylesterase